MLISAAKLSSVLQVLCKATFYELKQTPLVFVHYAEIVSYSYFLITPLYSSSETEKKRRLQFHPFPLTFLINLTKIFFLRKRFVCL